MGDSKYSYVLSCCIITNFLPIYTYLAGIPHDGVAKNTIVTVHPFVIAVFIILASAGIAFTAFCLFINYYFRKKKYNNHLMQFVWLINVMQPTTPKRRSLNECSHSHSLTLLAHLKVTTREHNRFKLKCSIEVRS